MPLYVLDVGRYQLMSRDTKWCQLVANTVSHSRVHVAHMAMPVLQHVGSDADVEANTKLKGLEEKLAAVGQNISSRVKVKEVETEDEEEEGALQQAEGGEHAFGKLRLAEGNGDVPHAAGRKSCNNVNCVLLGFTCMYSFPFNPTYGPLLSLVRLLLRLQLCICLVRQHNYLCALWCAALTHS